MSFTLCNIHDIADPGARGFELERNGEELNIFLVKKDFVFSPFAVNSIYEELAQSRLRDIGR